MKNIASTKDNNCGPHETGEARSLLPASHGSALAERATEAAKLATELQHAGDSVAAIACAIKAAQLLQLHKLLHQAPNENKIRYD